MMFVKGGLCFLFVYFLCGLPTMAFEDEATTRSNTLSDDADDIQRQLDIEARERMKFGPPKNIWVFNIPNKISKIDDIDGDRRIQSRHPKISKLRPSQSPIAISLQRCPTWRSLEPLRYSKYWDNPSKATLLNTGQTAYFTFDGGPKPIVRGGPLIGEYIFEQMHLHWSVDDFTGCEHVLDGHGYAAEVHFVHFNSKYKSLEAAVGHPDGLAVVGFLLEAVDAPNPLFDTFVEGLDVIKKRDQTVQVPAASISWMDRPELHSGNYVTYKGSLTTPPYTECVTWIIYQSPVQIGYEQLGLLRQLEGLDSKPIERNVRPTQRHPPGHSVIYVEQPKSKL